MALESDNARSLAVAKTVTFAGLKPRHLPGEDVQIDVGRGEHDVAEMAGEIAIVGDRLLAQSLHRQPAAHRVGEHMNFADAGRRADLLQ